MEYVGHAGEGDWVDRVIGAVDPLSRTDLAVGWEVEAVIVVGGEAHDEGGTTVIRGGVDCLG